MRAGVLQFCMIKKNNYTQDEQKIIMEENIIMIYIFLNRKVCGFFDELNKYNI